MILLLLSCFSQCLSLIPSSFILNPILISRSCRPTLDIKQRATSDDFFLSDASSLLCYQPASLLNKLYGTGPDWNTPLLSCSRVSLLWLTLITQMVLGVSCWVRLTHVLRTCHVKLIMTQQAGIVVVWNRWWGKRPIFWNKRFFSNVRIHSDL